MDAQVCTLISGLAIKNPSKKTQKKTPKKPTKNVFFWGFFKFFMKIIQTLKKIFYEQLRHKLSFIYKNIVRYALNLEYFRKK
jgi:hypothetical protein